MRVFIQLCDSNANHKNRQDMVGRRNSVVTATVREARYFECWVNQSKWCEWIRITVEEKSQVQQLFHQCALDMRQWTANEAKLCWQGTYPCK